MTDLLFKLIPVVAIFLIGIVLKATKVLRKEDGDVILKIVFYLTLPALIIKSISGVEITTDFIIFPFISTVTIMIMFGLAMLANRFFDLPKKSMGVFIISLMILNIGFTLPFVQAAYGYEGLARVTLFDFMNGVLIFTLAYYLACRFGGASGSKTMIRKFLVSVPLWSLVVSILMNLFSISLPERLEVPFGAVGDMTGPLLILSLGVFFNPKLVRAPYLFTAVAVRAIGGLLIGLFFCTWLHIEGIDRSIILIGTSAPVGFNVLVFSSLENLDKEFAASIVSYSILVGIAMATGIILLT